MSELEQGGNGMEDVVMRVNKYDVLHVLLQFVSNVFGVIAGFFGMLSQLSRAHALYVDDAVEMQNLVQHDIEMLGGE